MPKDLNIENPLDNHLKPVKDSDGTDSALEISTEDVRVKNLKVSGTTTGISISDDTKLPLAGGTVTGDITMSDAGLANVKEIIMAAGEDGISLDGGSSYIQAFKDEVNMASNSDTAICSQQSIKAYVDANSGGGSSTTYYWTLNAGFNYGSGAGTKVYVPLNGYVFEASSTSGRNEFQTVVAPHDGYLSRVTVRSEEACGSSVVGLHISGDNTEIPNTTASHSVTVDMAADDIGYSFDFSDSASFSKGNVLAVSFDPTNDANDTILTAVFIMDGST